MIFRIIKYLLSSDFFLINKFQNPPYTFPADGDDDEEVEKGAVVKLFDYLTKRLKFK